MAGRRRAAPTSASSRRPRHQPRTGRVAPPDFGDPGIVDSTMVARSNRRRARDLVRTAIRTFPTSDLALWAAGATFFGVLGLVPLALVALWSAAKLVGPDQVIAGMDTAVSGLPAGHGT